VPNIAVTNYSINIYKSAPELVSFYTLKNRKKFLNIKIPGSIPITGDLSYFGGEINLNRILPKFAFKKFYESLKIIGHPNGIMHYSAQYIVPFDKSTNNIVTVHDIMVLAGKAKVSTFGKRITEKAVAVYSKYENVLTDLDYVKKQLIGYGFQGNITVIPYPVSDSFAPISDKSKLRSVLGLPKEKKLILSVSGFNSNKNIPLVKKLTKILPENYKIVRVGGEIKDCINFVNIDNQTLNKIYNACDVLIQPSTDEGFGGPVAEAMAVKLPMVISDIEPFHEITDGFTYFADPFSPESFLKIILEAIDNPQVYTEKAYIRSKQFHYKIFREKIRSYYMGILSSYDHS
jgi:glycosyltransferase involved in cell wall biosynthesis